MSISSELFADFLNCKYKAYLKLIGKPGNKSDFEQFQNKLLHGYQHSVREYLLKSYEILATNDAITIFSEIRKQQPPVAINVAVATDEATAILDAIERNPKTPSRKPGYIPILFFPKEKISKNNKLLLAFCGSILGQQQKSEVRFGKIIHGVKFPSSKVQLGTLLKTVNKIKREITELKDTSHPPPLRLNAHCEICEFRETCYAIAKEKDDLSLLKSLSKKEIEALNKRGIFTVTQYSYTFKPRRARKRAAHPVQKHHHSLNALAIRTQTIYIAQKQELPSATLRLYLDVEGCPDENFYYLIGLLIDDGTSITSDYFWANKKSEEKVIWGAFLEKISGMKDFVLFHYGSYESRFIKQMKKSYGGNAELLDKLGLHAYNALSAIYGTIYFPTYSNGLKSIASFLGFNWSGQNSSGLQSLLWRAQWEESKDEVLKQKLITYNHEDCLALRVVIKRLESIFANDNVAQITCPTKHTDEIKKEKPLGMFKKNDFYFPELERINNCAYFDYQRAKVYFRTNPSFKKILKRKKQNQRTGYKVNKVLSIERAVKCPLCKAKRPRKHGNYSRIVNDLKVFDGGIKRWVVQYKYSRYFCKECHNTFFPETWAVAPHRHGPTLMAWAVNQNIARLKSYGMIAEDLRETFGYSFRRNIAFLFKKLAAHHCNVAYHNLIDKLRRGDLIHVDETYVNIMSASGTGYVWVFSNLEEVIYLYQETREGSILKEVLDRFKGVLVSDFYTAYDSVPCAQQKCLIHLIRDINEDILKNPFDEEMKALGRDFTVLLTPIIETIDKYGLKKMHFNKHKSEVRRFFKKIERKDYASDSAKNFQRRFLKYSDKLFTFLDYDGVPWNNNNAEHAIKRFVFLRKVIGGSSTAKGIQEYLVLLSICETLRLKNASFLKFLISGAADIDEFLKVKAH